MNDPRLHLSQTNDHNFKDPFPLNRSRSSPDEISCSSTFPDHEFVQFRPNSHSPNAAESDDSGVCSPPLWKSSPSTPSEPLLSHHVYRSLSPASRIQAITRGQKELMEMVRNMPESSYELSLKDLVEHHPIEPHAPPPPRVRRQESRRNMARNGSLKLENKGMLLKMVFPFSLQQPKKRSSLDRSFSGRVLPVKIGGGGGGGGGGEGDWWRKKLGCSSDSDSSRISVNSGGGGSSRSSSAGSSSCRSYGDGRYVGFSFYIFLMKKIGFSFEFSKRGYSCLNLIWQENMSIFIAGKRAVSRQVAGRFRGPKTANP